MSRMPANMSLKAFAPRIASPDTTPLYSPMRLSWSVLVVVSSMPTSRLYMTMCGAGRTTAWHVDRIAPPRTRRPPSPLGETRPAVWPVFRYPSGGLPGPAEFLQGPAGVPDFGHVADLAVRELHHVDVVAAGALAGGGHRAALAGVGAGEHGVGADVVALMVGGEGLDRVAPVRDEAEQPLHPLGVLLERTQAGERFGLGREARVRLAVGAALS